MEKSKHSWWYGFIHRIELPLALRAGVAASFALIVELLFGAYFPRPDRLISGLWCVVTAIIVSQSNLGSTLKAAKNRFLGVFIGCILGGLFTTYFGANILSVGISISLTVIICSIMNLQDSLRIASLSVAVVMLLWGIQQSLSPWTFAFYRFIDSCLGIIVAITVSHLIFPSAAFTEMRHCAANALMLMNELYHSIIRLEFQDSKLRDAVDAKSADIKEALNDAKQRFEESKLEMLTDSSNIDQWSLLINHLERTYELILGLEAVFNTSTKEMMSSSLEERLKDLTLQTEKTMVLLATEVESEQAISATDSLAKELSLLNDELLRYRTTRTTRQFELPDVQNFFVLFYSLRAIAEELQKIDNCILFINRKNG